MIIFNYFIILLIFFAIKSFLRLDSDFNKITLSLQL